MIVSCGKWNRKCEQNLARNEFAICLAWVRHLVKLFWDRAWGLELHRWVQWTSFGREVLCNCYTVVFRGLKIVKALTVPSCSILQIFSTLSYRNSSWSWQDRSESSAYGLNLLHTPQLILDFLSVTASLRADVTILLAPMHHTPFANCLWRKSS